MRQGQAQTRPWASALWPLLSFLLILLDEARGEACIRHTPDHRLEGAGPPLEVFWVNKPIVCPQKCVFRRPPCEAALHQLFPNGTRLCHLFAKDSELGARAVPAGPHEGQLNLYEIIDECQSQNGELSGFTGESEAAVKLSEAEPPMAAGDWGPWSPCSRTCAPAKRSRQRLCAGPDGSGVSCGDGERELEECGLVKCMGVGEEDADAFVPPNWGRWTEWGSCSRSCGPGIRLRRRACIESGVAAEESRCRGLSADSEPCETKPCLEFSASAVLPGVGSPPAFPDGFSAAQILASGNIAPLKASEIEALKPSFGPLETRPTQTIRRKPVKAVSPPAPVRQAKPTTEEPKRGFWSPWYQWSTCSASCGPGQRTRARECTIRGLCNGPLEQIQPCQSPPCRPLPVVAQPPAIPTEPIAPSPPLRTVNSPTPPASIAVAPRAPSPSSKSPSSPAPVAPVFSVPPRFSGETRVGRWSAWSSWSACSASCGTGLAKRTRRCLEGECPGRSDDARVCKETEVCGWASWTGWSPCGVSCGEGVQRRSRLCPLGEGRCVGASHEDQQCRDPQPPPCPVSQWASWEDWTLCSVTCGPGSQSRSRVCGDGKTDCVGGSSSEVRSCISPSCGGWSSWNPWGDCSVSCGRGERARFRRCPLGPCPGSELEREACRGTGCPERRAQAKLLEWEAWAPCSVTCGVGLTRRGATDGREETGSCEAGACPIWTAWRSWALCSSSCGDEGTQSRERFCTGGKDVLKEFPPSACKEGKAFETRSCGRTPCPAWAKWTDWEECNVSCGKGKTQRFRFCSAKGKCPGEGFQQKDCAKPACIEWSTWTTWNRCSVSCGIGFRTRRRLCENGSSCPGEARETGSCDKGTCPAWNGWGQWSDCSVSCAQGQRQRHRACKRNTDVLLPQFCGGNETEAANCNLGKCPVWESWLPWGTCSASCGPGVQVRTRNCQRGPCLGSAVGQRECQLGACPVWDPWTAWGVCSVTCGFGLKKRQRACRLDQQLSPLSEVLAEAGPQSGRCQGQAEDSTVCDAGVCAEWAFWQRWAPCSRSCGGGSSSRKRLCKKGTSSVNAGECLGTPVDSRDCAVFPCPFWSAWAEWSHCTVSCGEGVRTRRRACDGSACEGKSLESAKCSPRDCPVWRDWAAWGACSVSCGFGLKERTRQCSGGPLECSGEPKSSAPCSAGECPKLSDWGEWAACSESCGGGERGRVRSCRAPDGAPVEENLCNGPLEERHECNRFPCPAWAPWASWTACSRTCGKEGRRFRTRDCFGGRCLGEGSEEAACPDPKPCPEWEPWESWGACTKSCATGIRTRSRTCSFGFNCLGDGTVTEECNRKACPSFRPWAQWSLCTASCGGGTRNRTRECGLPEGTSVPAKHCRGEGESLEVEPCAETACPAWDDWAAWTVCTVTCGGGRQQRSRNCFNGLCRGDPVESRPCGLGTCTEWAEWAPWSPCSATCGPARQTRTRRCKGGVNCPGLSDEFQGCRQEPCSAWDFWASWSGCSVSCGIGFKQRRRLCQNPLEARKVCRGSGAETEVCQERECPEWGEWVDWSACDRSCGGGSRRRFRKCLKGTCAGRTADVQSCGLRACPAWLAWQGWSACSVSCGDEPGQRSRGRRCANGPCSGDNRQTEQCLGFGRCEDVRPQWTQWTAWSQCPVTCGGGQRFRQRNCLSARGPSDDCQGGSFNEITVCGSDPCRPQVVEILPASSAFLPAPREEEEIDRTPTGDFGTWSTWTDCSVTCGLGVRTRDRSCLSDSCQGRGSEIVACDTFASCPDEEFPRRRASLSRPKISEGLDTQFAPQPPSPRVLARRRGSGPAEPPRFRPALPNLSGIPASAAAPPLPPAIPPVADRRVVGAGLGAGAGASGGLGGGFGPPIAPAGDRSGPGSGGAPGILPASLRPLSNLRSEAGGLSNWGGWSECSATCGRGQRRRSRECLGKRRELCVGAREGVEECLGEPCAGPFWASWESWGPCAGQCGSGIRIRQRTCIGGSGTDCGPQFREFRACRELPPCRRRRRRRRKQRKLKI